MLAEFLQEKLDKEGLQYIDVEQKTGISAAYISRIINKKRVPSDEILLKIAKGLNLDIEKLITMAHHDKAPDELKKHFIIREKSAKYGTSDIIPIDTSKLRKIPVISWVHAGKWTECIDNYPPGWAEEYIYSDVKGEHVFAAKIQNDCMTPEFTEGEYVIVNPDIQVENGNFIIARNKETEETCLRQYKDYGKTKILHCLNPKYEDEVIDHTFEIVGKVVEKKKIY